MSHGTSSSVQSLFKPFVSKNLRLSNRIVMAPMTRGFSPNGVPGMDVANYYRRRAENGVGLIITEGTLINHPAASGNPNWPNFHGEASLNGWKQVVDEVHKVGGKIIPQLWHIGTQREIGSLPNPEALPVGPSGLTGTEVKVNEPMTEKEINTVIKAYAQAAADAIRIGFDGIELHGAHGYLIDQFFWEKTNRRTDPYGGNLIKRTRFAVEVIEACRHAVGPDFAIVFRFSQWKIGDYTAKLARTPEELAQFLEPLVDAGVDIFHCSTRRYWEPEFTESDLNLAGWTKKLTGKPTITVGSIGIKTDPAGAFIKENANNIEGLANRMEHGEFNLISVGRALLVDPAWVKKVQNGDPDQLVTYTPEATKTLF